MARSEVAPLACSSVIIGARCVRRARSGGLCIGFRALLAGLRGELRASTKATQLLAAAFGGGERRLGAIRDEAGLELSHESHLLQHKATGGALDLRQIREANVHAGVEQHREKSDRAGEPVDLRHDKSGPGAREQWPRDGPAEKGSYPLPIK
jgi:hypothetical protein